MYFQRRLFTANIDNQQSTSVLSITNMKTAPVILKNKNGGYYTPGKAFGRDKWYELADLYDKLLESYGECSAKRLAQLGNVSKNSAEKAMFYYDIGIVVPPYVRQGNGRHGVGSIAGMSMHHHQFVYQLYTENPSLPLDGYVQQLFDKFGLVVGTTTIQRWFMQIGPFKGTMRVTSRFPSGRNSWATTEMLRLYLDFIVRIHDHKKLVFADEKPMKEIDIYGCVRRDPLLGGTPYHEMEANVKNRYSILSAVTLKTGNIKPVEYVILEATTDSCLFLQFVRILLERGTIARGDVFVVDNCSVHLQGDNVGIQEELFVMYGILMITLPPYHPDYNPTELVFNTLLQRLKSARARYNCLSANDFVDAICLFLDDFNHEDVVGFYNKCGYYL